MDNEKKGPEKGLKEARPQKGRGGKSYGGFRALKKQAEEKRLL